MNVDKNYEITRMLEGIKIINEASNIILSLIEGSIEIEKVIRLRELAKEFANKFNFSGPIAYAIKLLPTRPLIPGAPVIRIALKVIDKEALKSTLNYLKILSAITSWHLKNSLADKLKDRENLGIIQTLGSFTGGRIFEVLSEIYLNKVCEWPELYPVDFIPWLTEVNKKGKPDLFRFYEKNYEMYLAEVSKSFKDIKDYKYVARFLIDAVKNRNLPYPSNFNKIKKLHYAIIAYEQKELQELEKIKKAFNNEILNSNLISKNKLCTEVIDLNQIKQCLEGQKDKNIYAGHLFAILKEMKLF